MKNFSSHSSSKREEEVAFFVGGGSDNRNISVALSLFSIIIISKDRWKFLEASDFIKVERKSEYFILVWLFQGHSKIYKKNNTNK
jgi:hypothetical protein